MLVFPTAVRASVVKKFLNNLNNNDCDSMMETTHTHENVRTTVHRPVKRSMTGHVY